MRIGRLGNLTDTNGWAEEGTISAPREPLDWTDAASTNRNIRFYRILRDR